MVCSDRATNILSASAVSLWLPSGPNPGPMSHHRAPPPVWGEGLSLTPKDRLKSEKCEMFDCWCRYIYSLEKETHLIKPGSSEIKEKILSMLNLVTHLLPPAPGAGSSRSCRVDDVGEVCTMASRALIAQITTNLNKYIFNSHKYILAPRQIYSAI